MNYKLIIGLLICAVSLIFFNDKLSYSFDFLSNLPDASNQIGKANIISGKGTIKKSANTDFVPIRKTEKIYHLDVIQTDGGSSLKIELKNHLVFVINENSQIQFENTDNRGLFVHFKSGDYQIVENGDPDKVMFYFKNRFFDPSHNVNSEQIVEKSKDSIDLQETNAKEISSLKKEDFAKTIVEEIKIPLVVEGESKVKKSLDNLNEKNIPTEQIQLAMQSKKPLFIKCYTQFLIENPNSIGHMNLSFTVEPQGKVSFVSILNSSFSDSKFLNCTKSIVEEIKIKSFKGQSIVFNYPVSFE